MENPLIKHLKITKDQLEEIRNCPKTSWFYYIQRRVNGFSHENSLFTSN